MSKKIYKILSLFLCLLLVIQQTGFAQVAVQLDISGHLSQLHNTFPQDKFRPLHLRYLYYNPQENGFRLLLDKGDAKNLKDQAIEQTTKELLNYFFVGVTLPNDSFWVNLRPDSPANIIDPALAQTDVGKVLLEADLQLKKDTAKYTSPDTPEGKEYWDKLYKKAGEIFGLDNVTIPTLTRPWIVPDEIIVREAQDNAYIYKATLKVMLEQDYLKDSSVYNFKDERQKELNEYSSQLIRELIIPKLTKEVNTAKRYASLRQVYYSLILAQWFKSSFANKNSPYSAFIDRRNLTGFNSKEDWSKATYFQAYQKSFEDGEYNIKEPVYTPSGQTIRSYFSGGIALQQTPRQPLPAGEPLMDAPPYTQEASSYGTPENLQVELVKKQPLKGTPATLLRYMHANRVFSDNPKKSSDMALQRGGNDSLRTIQRELQVLRAVGLVEGDARNGYYIPEWIKAHDPEAIIKQNQELNFPSPSDEQIGDIKTRIEEFAQAGDVVASENAEEQNLPTVIYRPNGRVTAVRVIRDAFKPGQRFTLDDYLEAVSVREEFQYKPLQPNGYMATDNAAKRDLQALVAAKIIDVDKTKEPWVYSVRKITRGVTFREEELLAQKRSDEGRLIRSKENRKRHTRGRTIYFFRQGEADGSARLDSILGNKGANLAEMANMGLPVPPGFTVSTRTTNQILATGEFPPDFSDDLHRYVKRIERQTGYKFGDGEKPLFLSARAGAKYSMPGFLKTVTNIGFNDETAEGLARLSGNSHFAYNSYIRFLLDYAEEVLNIERTVLEGVIQAELDKVGATVIDVASVDTLKTIVHALKNKAKEISHSEIPSDPFEQLANSVMAVVMSWNTPEARTFRQRNSIPHDIGTAVNIQAMVFGNFGENSGTGVVFTRNPLNGEKEVFGEVLFNAQGKDIVGGRVTPLSLDELDRRMPDTARELRVYLETLEKRFKEIQDVEFTIQGGKLYILQTRGNERRVTPLARVRILIDLVREGLISEEDAFKRIGLKDVLWFKKYLEAPIFNPQAQRGVLTTGIPASPGVAEGKVCFNKERAINLAQQGQSVILVLNESFPQDEEAIKAADGTLTKLGGATSHAAIVARGGETMKPVVVGASQLQFEGSGFRVGNKLIREGDHIVLDGNSGRVFEGRIEEHELMPSEVARVLNGSLPESESTLYLYYKRLLKWVEIKQKEESDAAFVREAEAALGNVSYAKKAAQRALTEARAVMNEHPTNWREGMQDVSVRLLGAKEEPSEGDRFMDYLAFRELPLALRYIYTEDPQLLAKLLHTQGLKHVEVLRLFNDYLDLDFGIVLFNLLGSFNAGDFTDEEYHDFLNEAKFPIIRLLIGLRDWSMQEKYLAGASDETLASVIEESVRFIEVYSDNIFAQMIDRISYRDCEYAREICKRIAGMIYDNESTRNLLLGIGDSRGRLSQKAVEWFNPLIEEVSAERLDRERQQRLRKSPTASGEDIAIPREEYPEAISDSVEDWTHQYYAYYGNDAEGELQHKAGKIINFGEYFLSYDDPSTIEHLRQYLEYAFADDEAYYLDAAFPMFAFSYFSDVADGSIIQKVFGAVSPKIAIKFLNYVATLDTREDGLTAQFLQEPSADKTRFFRIVLDRQSGDRLARIKSSLTPEAMLILATIEQAPPGTPATLLRYMHANKIFADNPRKSSELALQRGGNDSLRTIQRELQVLREVGLIGGNAQTGYYLSDRLKNIDPEKIIEENLELNKPILSLEEIQAVQARILSSAIFEREGNAIQPKAIDPKTSSAVGGIDFRNLPIVTQAISNLSAGISLTRLNSINLDSEWREIENLVNSGIIPSAERIKEYVQASSYKGYAGQDKRKVILCISGIFRFEEEGRCSTDPVLKDILVVLESGMSANELKSIFIGIK